MRNTRVGLLASYNCQSRIFLLILLSTVLRFIGAAIISKASELDLVSTRYLEPTTKTGGALRTTVEEKRQAESIDPSVRVLYRGTPHESEEQTEQKTLNQIPPRNKWPSKGSPLDKEKTFQPLGSPSKNHLKDRKSSAKQSLKKSARPGAQGTTEGLLKSPETKFYPEHLERIKRLSLVQAQINEKIRKIRSMPTPKQMDVGKEFLLTPHAPSAATFRQEFQLAGRLRPGEQFHPAPSPQSLVQGQINYQTQNIRFMPTLNQMSVDREFLMTPRTASATFRQEFQPPGGSAKQSLKEFARPGARGTTARLPKSPKTKFQPEHLERIKRLSLVQSQINEQIQEIRSIPTPKQMDVGKEFVLTPHAPSAATFRQEFQLARTLRPGEQFHPAPSPHSMMQGQTNDRIQNLQFMSAPRKMSAGREFGHRATPAATLHQEIQPHGVFRPGEQFHPAPSPHGTSDYNPLNRGNRGHLSLAKKKISPPPGFSEPQNRNTQTSIYTDPRRYADAMQSSPLDFKAPLRQNSHRKQESAGSEVPRGTPKNIIKDEDLEAVMNSLDLS